MFEMAVEVTGDKELDAALTKLIEPYGEKSINAEMRKACRLAVTNIVKPTVLALVPNRYGFLESQITVRAGKNTKNKMSFWVGFKDPLFKGDTYYGGFIEFGWDHYKGVTVEADSFLRRALYPNARKIIEMVRGIMREWVADANKLHTYGAAA